MITDDELNALAALAEAATPIREWPGYAVDRVGRVFSNWRGNGVRQLVQRLRKAEAIVRDLAKRDPMTDPDPMPGYCILCAGDDDRAGAHSRSCPWQRAVESQSA